jgi:UDP-N-acetylglucosamine acyltransferase
MSQPTSVLAQATPADGASDAAQGWQRGVSAAATVHPSALVEPGASVAAGASIGPWCHVGPEVVIEAGARLVSHVVVDGVTRIGEGAMLFPFCTVGLAPQDLKYRGEPTRCEIGARTQVREHCSIHRGTVTGTGVTRVGADCLLMAVVHVAHDCALGDGVIVANNVVMGGHVTIGARAVIGGASALHQFVRIGRMAMVGGVTGVEADVIPFGRVIGNRARLAGLNLVGLQRSGLDRAGQQRLVAAFRALFPRRLDGVAVYAERLERVREAQGQDPLVAEVLAFLDAPSGRGVIGASTRRDEEG